jgi:methanogenic corrinoid protein MtbC1
VTGTLIRPGSWDTYWQALAGGDSATAVQVALELHQAGMSLVDVLEGLVAAAQVEVGSRWAANEWNVAQEHCATSVSEEVVAALAGRIAVTPHRGAAVVGCVDGDWHALPSRVVATALREDGWRVHYLGASVPVGHLSQFLQDTGPDLVAISCSISTNLRRARRMIEAARDAGVPVLAGGPGFGPDGRWATRLGANATASSAREATALVAAPTWPRFVGPAPAHLLPDAAADLLARHRGRLVLRAEEDLSGRWPAMGQYNEEQLLRTVEDLGYLVDFLSAALYVDDVDLYRRFVGWMDGVLVVRGVPGAALRAGIGAVERAIISEIGDQPRAAAFLRAVADIPSS